MDTQFLMVHALYLKHKILIVENMKDRVVKDVIKVTFQLEDNVQGKILYVKQLILRQDHALRAGQDIHLQQIQIALYKKPHKTQMQMIHIVFK